VKKPRILLADDHTIVVEGLASLLEPDFELADTAENGQALVAAAQKLKPDVILLDISMPILNGIEAARLLRKTVPQAKLVFLSMHDDVRFVREAFRAGACGYLLKKPAPSELSTAIREVLQDRFYVTPHVARDVVRSFIDSSDPSSQPPADLTSRQRQILQLVAEGRSIKEIAHVLNLSAKTVEYHKHCLIERLGVRTTSELTKYAVKWGIISL